MFEREETGTVIPSVGATLCGCPHQVGAFLL